MSLTINAKKKEGILILDLSGRLTVGEEVTLLRDKFEETVSEDKNIILNLKEIDYIDSTGLGRLVMCYATIQKSGGALKLLHLSRRNIELLILTKLTTVFEIFNDEQDAINSFFPDRKIKKFDILSFVQGQGNS